MLPSVLAPPSDFGIRCSAVQVNRNMEPLVAEAWTIGQSQYQHRPFCSANAASRSLAILFWATCTPVSSSVPATCWDNETDLQPMKSPAPALGRYKRTKERALWRHPEVCRVRLICPVKQGKVTMSAMMCQHYRQLPTPPQSFRWIDCHTRKQPFG